jgi:flagellar basal-body rod protein FlgG
MFEGLYAAASGMEAQQSQLDALSNDMANLSTPGYQATKMGFHDLLYSGGGSATGNSLPTGAGTAASIVGRSQTQGSIQQTGQPLDVAITGAGYIEVRRPDGTIGLTRNGVLALDAAGRLQTNLGMPVQPPITVPRGVAPGDIKIDPNGTVHAGGRKLGKIALVTVPAPDKLLPDGESLFSATAASGALRAAPGARLQQGAVEASNVDIAQVMVQMIDTQQSFSLASKAIQYQDQMLGIANQVKR